MLQYDAERKNFEKQQFAAELVQKDMKGEVNAGEGGNDATANTMDDVGPGRFLRPLKREEIESLEIEPIKHSKSTELWTDAEKGKILEKIKQSFRQNRLDKTNVSSKKMEENAEPSTKRIRSDVSPDVSGGSGSQDNLYGETLSNGKSNRIHVVPQRAHFSDEEETDAAIQQDAAKDDAGGGDSVYGIIAKALWTYQTAQDLASRNEGRNG